MDLSDSEDDSYGPGAKYKKPEPQTVTVSATVATDEDFKQTSVQVEIQTPYNPVDHREVAVQPDPFQTQVAEVQNSSLVQGLEAAQLSPVDTQRCLDIIGYAPRDLTHRQVQQSLLASGHPQLREAFRNKMLRPFLVGVNSATFKLGCGMLSLEISRHLLTECIKRVGVNSKCRRQLVPIASQIQSEVDKLNEKRHAFVRQMAQISKKLGQVSNILRYNASPDAVVKRLQLVNTDLQATMADVEAQTMTALKPIEKGTEWILSVLENDAGYVRAQQNAKAKEQAWRDAMSVYETELNKAKSQQYQFQGDLIQAQTKKKTLAKQLECRRDDLKAIEKRLAQHEGTITSYMARRQAVQEGADMDEKEAEQLEMDTRHACKQEIEDQRAGFRQQIKLIEEEIRKKDHRIDDLRGRSKFATDGKERQTTIRRTGWFWRSYNYKTEYVQARPNEKLRLEKLAETLEREKAQLREKILELQQKADEVKRTVRNRMANDALKLKEQFSESRASARDRRVRQIEQQIVFMKELKKAAQNERTEINTNMEELRGQIAEEKTKIKNLQDQLAVEFDDSEEGKAKEHPTQLKLAQNKQDVEDARREMCIARQELQQYTANFGYQSGDDFASFMRIFDMLNNSIVKVPTTLKDMSAAFTVAAETFNSDVFRGDLDMLEDPEMIKQYLQDTTGEVHAMCELAFKVMDEPGHAMMSVDTSRALAAIASSTDLRAIAGPDTSDATEVHVNEAGQEYRVEEPQS